MMLFSFERTEGGVRKSAIIIHCSCPMHYISGGFFQALETGAVFRLPVALLATQLLYDALNTPKR